MTLQWTGTAVWIYGEANASSYTVSSDWNVESIEGVGTDTGGGVLFHTDSLWHGLHTVMLTVSDGGSPVTIFGATITVGLGELG